LSRVYGCIPKSRGWELNPHRSGDITRKTLFSVFWFPAMLYGLIDFAFASNLNSHFSIIQF